MKLKDLHNIRQKVKTKNNLSDADQIVNIVKDLKARGDTADIVADEEGGIQMIYIQTQRMKQSFKQNPDIIFMDATYKTNKQGYTLQCLAAMNEQGCGEPVAYAFLLSKSLSHMCDLFKQQNRDWERIKTFMVDKEKTQIKVLQKNFEDANVLPCSNTNTNTEKKKLLSWSENQRQKKKNY